MAQDISVPDPTIILDLIESFRRSKTMFSAVSLGVFDSLNDGPKPLSRLAVDLKTDSDALRRLLDACVGLQLLQRNGVGEYATTPAAATYLTSTSPRRFTGYINYSNTVLWKLWGNLEDAIREGTNRWKQTYGWDSALFENFFRTPESLREFLMGMNGFGVLSSPAVVNPSTSADIGSYSIWVVRPVIWRSPHARDTPISTPLFSIYLLLSRWRKK